MNLGVQLYSLRNWDRTLTDALTLVEEAGFDGIELAGFDNVSPAVVATTPLAGVHVPIGTLTADPTAAVDRCHRLGTGTVVVPITPETSFADADRVEVLATRLDDLATVVEAADGRLLYHNHEFEFRTGPEPTGDASSKSPYERLIERTARVDFELDVGWATAAGADPIRLLETHGDRIPLIHLKDVVLDADAPRGARPVDLGEGVLEVEGCLEAARAAGVEWVVFEHDDSDDPERTVRQAGRVLRRGR